MQNQKNSSESGINSERPKGNIRPIWLLMIIVAVIVIGGALYYLIWYQPMSKAKRTPSENEEEKSLETKEQITFTNDKYGFKIVLPEGWEYTEKEEAEKKIGTSPLEAYDFFFFYPSYEKEEFDKKWEEGGDVSAVKLIIIEGETVDQIASGFSGESECQVKNETFGNVEGKGALCNYNPEYPKQSYIIGNEKAVFVFQASGLTEKREALDSMIQTFEFTN